MKTMFMIYVTTFSSDSYGEGYYMDVLFHSKKDAKSFASIHMNESDDFSIHEKTIYRPRPQPGSLVEVKNPNKFHAKGDIFEVVSWDENETVLKSNEGGLSTYKLDKFYETFEV